MDHHPHKITFTIITVSYNCRTLIEKTIESVLQQDFPAKEYILIDGGSTDGTAEIIKNMRNTLLSGVLSPMEVSIRE